MILFKRFTTRFLFMVALFFLLYSTASADQIRPPSGLPVTSTNGPGLNECSSVSNSYLQEQLEDQKHELKRLRKLLGTYARREQEKRQEIHDVLNTFVMLGSDLHERVQELGSGVQQCKQGRLESTEALSELKERVTGVLTSIVVRLEQSKIDIDRLKRLAH